MAQWQTAVLCLYVEFRDAAWLHLIGFSRGKPERGNVMRGRMLIYTVLTSFRDTFIEIMAIHAYNYLNRKHRRGDNLRSIILENMLYAAAAPDVYALLLCCGWGGRHCGIATCNR